jgi:uncharacterized surface protein with fasciclin (FAS1) repeats
MYRRDLARAVLGIGIVSLIPFVPARAEMTDPDQTVFDVLMNDPRFTTTMKMVYLSGNADTWERSGRHVTVFAATDTAWNNSPYMGLMAIMTATYTVDNPGAKLTSLLRGFVVPHMIEPTDIAGKNVALTSSAGRQIEVDGKDMTVSWVTPDNTTKTGKVAGAPIQAANGVIYPMDVIVGA